MRLLSVDARTAGRDRGELARLIESAEADIACVHNAPHLLRWRSISAAIGRRSGLVVVGGGRPAGANLLLSTLGVDALATRDVRLGGSVVHRAGAVLSVLRHGGVEFIFVGACFVGNAAQRIEQSRALQHAITGLVPGAPPVVLCTHGAQRGTAAWDALVDGRVAVSGQLLVNARITVRASHELAGYAGASVPPVVSDISLD